MRLGITVVVAACWTSVPSPPVTPKPVSTAVSDLEEVRAVVRIDPAPGGKRFQGVWLELPNGKRWVVDYRAHGLWRAFENQTVVVTGSCYVPAGQAVMATHFKVAHMKFAATPTKSVPFLEIGAEELMDGMFVERTWPVGSKLSGTQEIVFRRDPAPGEYIIAGSHAQIPDAGTTARIRARQIKPDPTYAAMPGGDQIWIVSLHTADDDPEHEPSPAPCH